MVRETPCAYSSLALQYYAFFDNAKQRSDFYSEVVTRAQEKGSCPIGELYRAYVNLETSLREACTDWPDGDESLKVQKIRTHIMCYINECHVLYGPSSEEPMTSRTVFGEINSVLASLRSLFAIFMSTATPLSVIARPRHLIDSFRPVDTDAILMPPFTTLPFNQYAREYPTSPKDLTVETIANPEPFVHFGRPLWHSYFAELVRSKQDPATALNDTLNLAMSKLVARPPNEFYMPSQVQAIAVIAVRVLLEIVPATQRAVALDQALVKSHLRTCYSVPEHREFMRTGYPSEPILAEAAARLMNFADPIMLTSRRSDFDVWKHLEDFFNAGLGDQDEIGELISRMIHILSFDAAVNALEPIRGRPVYHRPVKLLDFLQHWLIPTSYNTVIQACPSSPLDGEESAVTLEEAFEHAYIFTTHWSQVGDAEVLTAKYTPGYWIQGCAFRMIRDAKDIDAYIPIHIDSGNRDSPITPESMSAILIQVRAGQDRSGVVSQSAEDWDIFGDVKPRPILTVTQWLNCPDKPVVIRDRTSQHSHDEARGLRRYDVVLQGLAHYKCLEARFHESLRALMNRAQDALRAQHPWQNAPQALAALDGLCYQLTPSDEGRGFVPLVPPRARQG